jgi:riboflavin transporter FmnP
MQTGKSVGRTSKIAAAAVSGALAFVLTLFFKVTFPFLPWLSFDFAEIPVMLSFLIYGPATGVASAFILFLILLARGSAFPPGPYMKLAAVLSMQLGVWLGIRLTRSLKTRRLGVSLSTAVGLGAVFRILLMTPINYLVVGILFAAPFYFSTASRALKATLGITFSGELDFIILMLIFTGVYNGLHTLLSVIPTFPVLKMPQITKRSWMIRLLNRAANG